MWKWFEHIIDRISEYLPDEDDLTEEEKAYEEGKARVLALHESGKDLFYVEEAWQERDGSGRIYGEIAKGRFRFDEPLCILDKYAEFLMEAVPISMKREEEQESSSQVVKWFLEFSEEEIRGKEDIFAQAFFLVKKDEKKC